MTTQPPTTNIDLNGAISDCRVVRTAAEGLALDALPGTGVDLVHMASDAMTYLLKTPRPHLDYACRFANFLGHYPPGPAGEDLVANGDSDCRMDWEYAYLREMTGRRDGLDVDRGVRRRILSYVTEQGYAMAAGGIYCGGEVDRAAYYISNWSTGKILYTLAETFARDGDEDARTLARKMFLALKSLATVEGDKAWFVGGSGPYLDGKWYETFITFNYGAATEPVLHYARLCGDEEAWDFAGMLARGTAAGIQANLGDRRVRDDGSFADHTHLHTHETWGVADVAATLGDPALLAWARRVYEFVRRMGGDSGFFPERMVLPGTTCWGWNGYPERVFLSETCITGDMVSIAACLARAGLPEYYDHIERYVRNYLHHVQFFVTPALEAYYRTRHAHLPLAEVEAGLRMLRDDYQGGFLGHVGLNDWIERAANVELAMVGCCVPEGMRALYTAWQQAVVTDEGCTRVNMHFSRETPQVCVRSYLPEAGRLSITMRCAGALAVRIPAWAPAGSVQARRNGQAEPVVLQGAYAHFSDLHAGDVLEVAYDLMACTQQVAIGGNPESQRLMTYAWQGNTIMGIDLAGGQFPMYPIIA